MAGATCDPEPAMVGEVQDDNPQKPSDREILARFGAFVVGIGVPLGYILARSENGQPENWAEIVVVAGLGSIAVVSLILAVNEYLDVTDRSPLISGVRGLTCVAVVVFAGLAGFFEATMPDDESRTAHGSAIYARHLQMELDELQGAGVLIGAGLPTSRRRYVERAHAIGTVYEEIAQDLRLLEVDREDRLAHRYLMRRVAIAGRAFHRLGNMVSARAADAATVNAARAGVAKKLAEVDGALRKLAANGYAIQGFAQNKQSG